MKARSIVFILYNYSQLPDAGKDRRQEEKATTEDEMVGWHHQLDGREFEQALGVGDEHAAVH